MNENVKCFKCGSDRFVIKHHISYNPEVVVDCCKSCHRTIHHRVRKEGACKYSIKEVERMSMKSSNKRSTMDIIFSQVIGCNVILYEQIGYNKNTGNVYVSSWFTANHGKSLIQEEI